MHRSTTAFFRPGFRPRRIPSCSKTGGVNAPVSVAAKKPATVTVCFGDTIRSTRTYKDPSRLKMRSGLRRTTVPSTVLPVSKGTAPTRTGSASTARNDRLRDFARRLVRESSKKARPLPCRGLSCSTSPSTGLPRSPFYHALVQSSGSGLGPRHLQGYSQMTFHGVAIMNPVPILDV